MTDATIKDIERLLHQYIQVLMAEWRSKEDCASDDHEAALLAAVGELVKRRDELQQFHDWASPQVARPVEYGVIDENNRLRALLAEAKRDQERLRELLRFTKLRMERNNMATCEIDAALAAAGNGGKGGGT